MVRTSTTSWIFVARRRSTNSSIERVECPMVKNGGVFRAQVGIPVRHVKGEEETNRLKSDLIAGMVRALDHFDKSISQILLPSYIDWLTRVETSCRS
jgi:hypothetical protein